MGEYQFVTFRAIDRPVNEANLKFMAAQSSRAEITKWSFTNEYHYGSFRGNALEMLRRGYDLHLHYTNFGTRTLMIRLPNGFPDIGTAEKYLDEDAFRFVKDKRSRAGCLVIHPAYEPHALDDLWDFEELVERLVPLRAEILSGDLRPLYLARLAIAEDDYHDPETAEGPVPAGLRKLTDAQLALAKLYGLTTSLIAAAARGAPALPDTKDMQSQYELWLRDQPAEMKDRWLSELIHDPHSGIRQTIQEAFRKENSAATWPVANLNRSIAQLEEEAERIAIRMETKAKEKAARQREKMLAKMAANPDLVLRETEKLVATSTSDGYKKATKLLGELREALAGTPKVGLAEAYAEKLHRDNPTKTQLLGALRRAGLAKKRK